MLVYFRVEAAESLVAEVSESRPLVVNEETSEPDRRLFRDHVIIIRELKFLHLLGPDVEPVDKRRYAEHLGDLEDTVDGASLIASRDRQLVAFDLYLIDFALTAKVASDRNFDRILDSSFGEHLRLMTKDRFHVAC